jgi:hypothetical protein
MSRTVQFILNKGNKFGLSKDVAVLKQMFLATGDRYNFLELDPNEPSRAADVQVHLEVPVYAAIPWSPVNIFLVNPEYYVSAYDAYLPSFDLVITRDAAAAARLGIAHFPFCGVAMPAGIKKSKAPIDGWLWVIGSSSRKMAAARAFLPLLEAGDQHIKIITGRADFAAELNTLSKGKNVSVVQDFLDQEELWYLQKNTAGHIVLSEAEGFSHAAAEARTCGAYVLASRCPVLLEYADGATTTFMGAEAGINGVVDCGSFRRDDWVVAQEALKVHKVVPKQPVLPSSALAALPKLRHGHLPPALDPSACPPISVITLTYNRRRFIDLSFHNLMWSDYPLDKIEWIVVDDSDNENAVSDKLMDFKAKVPALQLEYLPLAKKTSVADKRNLGCARATNDIIMFMDDDDHYPTTSFRRRVSWLLSNPKKKAAGCTTIALYDLVRGVSAVNVPPWVLPLGQRVSEASLAFYKSFWAERPFAAGTNVGEGETWVDGRESAFVEIPPQQIIVALSHQTNISSRRVPADAKPGCFWGFSPEFMKFLHGLAGVEIEFGDIKNDGTTKKKKK